MSRRFDLLSDKPKKVPKDSTGLGGIRGLLFIGGASPPEVSAISGLVDFMGRLWVNLGGASGGGCQNILSPLVSLICNIILTDLPLPVSR